MNSPVVKWQKLTDEQWLNLFAVSYRDPSDRTRQWQFASRRPAPKCVSGDFGGPDAVVIAAFHADKQQMVVTREYRIALADFEYGFPAGLVDPGETPQEAAHRELAEETGLRATRLVFAGPPIYSSVGMTDESVSMVYVECTGAPSAEGNQGSEQIEVLFVGPQQAKRLCEDPKIKFDAKAWLVLSVYGRTGSPWSCFPPA
jgi:ADP-ribose pyrophosphatase